MNITHITSDDGDWEGIYVDGVLQDEGHSLNVRQVLTALRLKHESREINFKQRDITFLPNKLEELELSDRAAEIKAGEERLREIFLRRRGDYP